MKNLGTTPNGGIIIELTHDEAQSFSLAIQAMKGKTLNTAHVNIGSRYPTSGDMGHFFCALEAFILANFVVNELSEQVNDLKQLLNISPSNVQKTDGKRT